MPDPAPTEKLAHILCELVAQRLWPLAETLGGQRLRGARLSLSAGWGRATYCRAGPDDDYRITFGRKMVASKCRADEAGAWITAREIRSRGYFGGHVTLSHLLAHTALHEFAHLLQIANGWRRPGSVHNRPFYTLLDRLHETAGVDALTGLSVRCAAAGLDLEAMQEWGRGALPLPRNPSCPHLTAGAEVEFEDRNGRLVRGVVRRVNRRSVTVWPAARSAGTYYRVPHERLRPVAGDSAGAGRD